MTAPSFKTIRHPGNSNLTLYHDQHYRGLEVMVHKSGPMIQNYLEVLYQVLHDSWDEYPRTLAIRVDLRFPKHGEYDLDDSCISRFIASMKQKIKHDRSRAAIQNLRFHDSRVRYLWAREFGKEGRPHYHVLLLLNHDAYFSLGSFDSAEENNYQRITSAWASALDIGYEGAKGLAEVPLNQERDCSYMTGLPKVFYRASYLCKAYSKRYDDCGRNFGSSRCANRSQVPSTFDFGLL